MSVITVPENQYTFDTVAKTITFNMSVFGVHETVQQNRIMLIENITTGALLYAPTASQSYLGSLVGEVLTLIVSTTGMTNGDELRVSYDSLLAQMLTQDQNLASLITEVKSMTEMLQELIVGVFNKQPMMDVNQRLRVVLEGIIGTQTLNQVTTVNSVAAINNFSGGNAAMIPYHGGSQLSVIYDNIKIS